jgi:hypothetical protein
MSLKDNATKSIHIVEGAAGTTFEYPNKFTLRLPASGFQSDRDEVALKSLSVYFSWPNISAEKGNNTFAYVWPDQSTKQVIMADGIWSFPHVQDYLQQVMREAGHYLLDQNGRPVYYISLQVNSTLYCLSLICTPLPATLPAGWTNPAQLNLAAAAGKCPQLVIPASLSKFTGFSPGSYPPNPQTSVYAINSGIPQVSDVTSLNLICNLVDNSGFSLTPGILTSFVMAAGQEAGTQINVLPNERDWVGIIPSKMFTEIELELVDQRRRPVAIRDPSGFVAVLNVRRRR